MRHNRLTPARAATALAQAARRATAALAIILLTATTAWAQEAITGLTYNSTGGYYEISDAQDLVELATYVNATGNLASTGKTFRQTADIDLGGTNFTPIGFMGGSYSFAGTYDGQGHAISGLTVSKEYGDIGLFGVVKGGTVSNVILLSPTVTATTTINYSVDLGALIGSCDVFSNLVENCHVVNPTVSSSSTGSNYVGAIIGNIWGSNTTVTNCYYYGGNANAAYGNNPNGATVTRVCAAHRVTPADGVTIQTPMAADLGFTCDADNDGTAENYWRTGAVLTLGYTGTAPDGYIVSGYTATNGTVGGNANDGYTLTMPNTDVTVTATFSTPDPNDFSQSGDTYIIHSAAGWNVFCDLLAQHANGYFSGKTVKLGDDITVTRMAGGQPFTGTFDGGGHTLTLDYGTADAPVDAQFVAPFIETAADGDHQPTFRNLTIGGTIYDGYTGSEAHNVGGLIGHLFGTVTIEHCTSNVSINATSGAGGFVGLCEHSVSFNDCHSAAVVRSAGGNNSGFVAWSRASGWNINFTGCLFDGKLLQQNGNGASNGGFIGWTGSNKTVTITNSLCAPAPLATGETMASSGSATFARGWNATTTATNCYDTAAFEIAQGKATRTVAADADVTIGAVALTGTATQYTVSGITAYSGGGLQHGETLYYGSDDQLSLTLSNTATGAPLGYRYDGYTASAGTLDGTTLTMPNENVTISVNTAGALAPIDWATVNEGNSEEDPYMIYNKDQLLLLAHRVNGTNGETANDYAGMYFKLGADITFSHDADEGEKYVENYEAIGGYTGGTYGNFKGNFDGDGHTVSGIRIRKTGSGDANSFQGLFGFIDSSADIHDVHLTDARIIGYLNVGGIAGLNYGTVSGCSVTDSYITATDYCNYGTICGWNGGTLTNNYYHGCTVNGTAVTSGVGCDGDDITANNGALPAYAITFGDGVSTTVLASAPENGFVQGGTSYYRLGLALPLASEAPEGYTLSFSAKGTALSGSTYTVNATDGDVTINTTLSSDGLQHEVNYMTADGTTQTAKAIALDGHEAVDGDGNVRLAGTYYVGTDIAYANQIRPDGDVTLILANGKTMTLNGNKTGIYGGYLTIYGQSLDAATAGTLRYNGTADGINVNNYVQHSGNVSITTTGFLGYGINADVTLRGGTLTISADGTGARAISGAMHSILGGHLTAIGTKATGIRALADDGTALTLGWIRPDDFITASSISTPNGTVAVVDGQALTDGSGNIYTGTLTDEQKEAIAGKTLRPCLALADAADNTAVITDHAGKKLAVALSGRTLYKDGSWNTLCLPFAVDLTASGTLSGDNVQAMTLDTENSNLTGSTLTLNFDAATTIPAGTPFIIKWDEPANYVAYDGTNAATCSDLVSPVFMGVTIDAGKHDATVTGVLTFTGNYAPVSIADADGDNTKLYLGADNTLYYPNAAMTIGCQRAYFQLLGDLTAGNPASGVRAFVLNFGDDGSAGDPARIHAIDAGEGARAPHGWYTLDGRRLDGQPTAKGLYIHGGKKVVIK